MITQGIFTVMFIVIGALLSWLPTISQLPTILGVNLDTVFSNGIGYFNRLAVLFPPFHAILIASLFYLTFKLGLILLKIVLGSRVPHAEHKT